MKPYFVSFYFVDQRRKDGMGNTDITLVKEKELLDIEDIREIEERIKKKTGNRAVVLTNIIPFPIK